MHKKQTMGIADFDPNAPACVRNNIFSLPSTEEESSVVLLPVPWEVTVSHRAGTARAPEYILSASQKINLYDPDIPEGWKFGFFMREVDKEWLLQNDYLRREASLYINFLADGGNIKENEFMQNSLHEINKGCQKLQQWVYEQTKELLQKEKFVGIIGGDHSVPIGYYKALDEQHDAFGILHIDAHLDLRFDYEGFEYSHAGSMYMALKELNHLEKLVSVGVRDYCPKELQKVEEEGTRMQVFFDRDIKRQLCEGIHWQMICDQIIAELPDKVYLSLDIDGLDPKLCPNTGTPVPGGLEFWQVDYLLSRLIDAGKQLIGFDLVEVGFKGVDWDANVGARMLFRLCNQAVISQSKKS